MNETINNLINRRSCRSYTDKQVPLATLNQILKAGTYAPTGMGKQSPLIVAIQDQKIINQISKINASIMGIAKDPFYGAPTLIVVFADSNILTYKEDGSLVLGNILNAAYSLGVDSCWIHRAQETFATPEGQNLKKEWHIPDSFIGIGNCILGYHKDPLQSAKPRKENYITIIK